MREERIVMKDDELIDLVITNVMETQDKEFKLIDSCSRIPVDAYVKFGRNPETEDFKMSVYDEKTDEFLFEEEFRDSKNYNPEIEFVSIGEKSYIRPCIILTHKFKGEFIETDLGLLEKNDYVIVSLTDSLAVNLDIIKNPEDKSLEDLFPTCKVINTPIAVVQDFITKLFSKGNKVEPYFILNDYIVISNGYKKYMEEHLEKIKKECEKEEHQCSCGSDHNHSHIHVNEKELVEKMTSTIKDNFSIFVMADKDYAKKLLAELIQML